MAVVAIAFTPAPPSSSPNLRAPKSDRDGLRSYYDAMELAFATYRRWAADADLRLVTDADPPDIYAERYRQLGVNVLKVPFLHSPPKPLLPAFNASLYSLDAMRALAEEYPSEPVALLDPDAVAVAELAPLFRRSRTAICAYPTGFPPGEVSNGLSAIQAAELHAILDPTLGGVPIHYGGECYGFTAGQIQPVLERAEAAYALALERAEQGLTRFATEEHIFNYALRGAEVDEVDDLVRRIWTAPRYRTVRGDESQLALWHLPAEKDRGFPSLLGAVRDPASWFWTVDGDEFRAVVGRAVGVGRRPPARWGYDQAGRAVRSVQRTAARVSLDRLR